MSANEAGTATPPGTSEGRRRVVDAHVHWRDAASNPYQLLSDAAPEPGAERGGVPATSYLPATYFDDAAAVEVVGCIHVEAEWDLADPVGETRWLEAELAAGRLGDRALGIVGFADLSDAGVDAVLAAHAAHPHVRGVRQILNRVPGRPEYCWAKRDHLADDAWHRGYARLAAHGLHFDLMCFAHQMPAMAALAARHPDVPVHLEHAGLPWEHDEAGRRRWREGLHALAALDHVDVKVSGLGNTVPDWSVGRVRRYVLETIEIFGTDRVAFASNFPTDAQFGSMTALWDAFGEIVADFSADERRAMFETNALGRYGLGRRAD